MKSRRRWRAALAGLTLLIAAALAGCDASNVPRGGPQLPSNPAFLSGSGDGTPTPSGIEPMLPAWMPSVGFGLATAHLAPRAL